MALEIPRFLQELSRGASGLLTNGLQTEIGLIARGPNMSPGKQNATQVRTSKLLWFRIGEVEDSLYA